MVWHILGFVLGYFYFPKFCASSVPILVDDGATERLVGRARISMDQPKQCHFGDPMIVDKRSGNHKEMEKLRLNYYKTLTLATKPGNYINILMRDLRHRTEH